MNIFGNFHYNWWDFPKYFVPVYIELLKNDIKNVFSRMQKIFRVLLTKQNGKRTHASRSMLNENCVENWKKIHLGTTRSKCTGNSKNNNFFSSTFLEQINFACWRILEQIHRRDFVSNLTKKKKNVLKDHINMNYNNSIYKQNKWDFSSLNELNEKRENKSKLTAITMFFGDTWIPRTNELNDVRPNAKMARFASWLICAY